MSHFIRNNNTYRVASNEALDIHNQLPVGNYAVKFDGLSQQFFLEMVDTFPAPKKLYGDTCRNADRILSTFMDRELSTGVMLNGEKGSGKTLLAKTLSRNGAEQGIPTLIINESFTGDTFNKFLQDITQPTIVLFDEFEKVFDNEDQEKALTLLDGVFPSKKLFIITCNDKWRVNEHMRNRPGRIYYMLDFVGLTPEFIEEYCNDALNSKEHIEKIVAIASLFSSFNFDMLKALVEEMNRYGETPQEALRMLNAKPEFSTATYFEVKLIDKTGREIPAAELVTKQWKGNPLNGTVYVEWDTDPDGDTPGTYHDTSFNASHITRVEAAEGRFTYKNQATEILILTRKKEENYNFLAF